MKKSATRMALAQLAGCAILTSMVAPAVAGPRDAGFGVRPPTSAPQQSSDDLDSPTVVRSKGGQALDATKFYIVTTSCGAQGISSATQISNGLLIKESQFVAHSLWLADKDSTLDGSVPQNPAKLLNVFSFDKATSGQTVNFQNNACSDTFLISGQNSKLTVSMSVTDTKELGPLGAIMFAAAKLVIGVVPLFITGPLQATVTNAAKDVGAAEDPLKAIIAAINRTPSKVAKSYDLRTEKTTIATKFSSVTVTVKSVDDIASQITSDNNLRASFIKILDGVSSSYLNGIGEANLRDKCGSFANTLVMKYTFSKKDVSFIEGYFAQAAFPANKNNRLTCIGNRSNANDIVAYEFFYNQNSGLVQKLEPQDIANFFAETGFNGVPLDSAVAQPYVDRLSGLLAHYAQGTGSDKEMAKAALAKWVGSDTFVVRDATSNFWLDDNQNVSPSDFADALAKSGLVRYGCMILKPTVSQGGYDAAILALPKKDGLQVGDALVLNVVLAATGPKNVKIMRIDLSLNGAAIVEAAKPHPECKIPVTVDKPGPQAQSNLPSVGPARWIMAGQDQAIR